MKALKIISALLIFVSVPGCIVSSSMDKPGEYGTGYIVFSVLCAVGFIGFIAGRLFD